MLITDLVDKKKQNTTTLLFKSAQTNWTAYSIFSDLKAKVEFSNLTIALHEGFIDNDLSLLLYRSPDFWTLSSFQIKRRVSEKSAGINA